MKCTCRNTTHIPSFLEGWTFRHLLTKPLSDSVPYLFVPDKTPGEQPEHGQTTVVYHHLSHSWLEFTTLHFLKVENNNNENNHNGSHHFTLGSSQIRNNGRKNLTKIRKFFVGRQLLQLTTDDRIWQKSTNYGPTTFYPIWSAPQPGFCKCNTKQCYSCSKATGTSFLRSAWYDTVWHNKQQLTCRTSNVIYILKCCIHLNTRYVGSTKNLKTLCKSHIKCEISNIPTLYSVPSPQHFTTSDWFEDLWYFLSRSVL